MSNSNLSFFSLSGMGQALSKGFSSATKAVTNSSLVSGMKEAAIKGIAKAAIKVLPPDLLKPVADLAIDLYVEDGNQKELASKAVSFLVEIKRHNSPSQIVKLAEQLFNLFKNHSEAATQFLSNLENKKIDLGSLLQELCNSNGANAEGEVYPNLNAVIVEVMKSAQNPALRRAVYDILSTVEGIARDEKLRAAAKAALQSEQAEELFSEIFDQVIASPKSQNKAMSGFKTQLVATATNDLWLGLSKAGSINKVSSLIATVKNGFGDDFEAAHEGWNAAASASAQRAINELQGVTHDLLKTGCLSQVIRYMPNELLAKLLPQDLDPTIKSLTFEARNSHSIKEAISLLMEPLARLYLNPTIQKVLKENKALANALAQEAASLFTSSSEGATPNIDRLFAELRPLMHDERSRTDLLDLIKAVKKVYSIEHLKDAVGKKLQTEHAKKLLAPQLQNNLGDFSAIENELVAFVTNDLWAIATEDNNSNKIADLGALIATKIEAYGASDKEPEEALTELETTTLHKELAEVANSAKEAATAILSNAVSNKNLHAMAKKVPAQSITLIKGHLDTISNQVENPLIKKVIHLLEEFQETEEGAGALASLVSPLISLFTHKSFVELMSRKDLDTSTLMSELFKVLTNVGGATPNLDTVLGSLDKAMRDPEARDGLKQLIVTLRALATDPKLRNASKEIAQKPSGAFEALSAALCEMVHELSGWKAAEGLMGDTLTQEVNSRLATEVWELLANDKNAALFDTLSKELFSIAAAYDDESQATSQATPKISKETVKATAETAIEIINGTASSLAGSILKDRAKLSPSDDAEVLYNTPGFEKAPAAAKFFAEYTDQFLLSSMQRYELDPTKPYWTDYFKDNILGMLTGKVYAENHEHMKTAIEALYMKMMKTLAARIEAKSAEDPEFMPKLTTEVINIFVQFFNKYEKATSQGAETLSPEELLRRFNDPKMGLHPLSSEAGQNERTAAIFKETTKKLVELLLPEGPKGLDLGLGIPEGAQNDLWNLLTETALPGSLCSLFGVIVSENSINNMLLSSFKNLEATLDGQAQAEIKGTKVSPPSSPKHKPGQTEAQKALNEASGNLLKQISKMLPWTAFSLVMKSHKIKELSGELLGDLIYNQVTKEGWNLNKIIDTSLENGLPNLHPGRWATDEAGRSRFIPLDEHGNEVESLKFDLPVTEEEIKIDAEKRKVLYAQTAAELEEVSVRVTDKAIHAGVRNIVVSKISGSLNWFLSLFLEEGTVAALQPLIEMIAEISYTLTIGLLWFICRPLWLWHLRTHAESSLQLMRNPILESPIHSGIESLLKNLD